MKFPKGCFLNEGQIASQKPLPLLHGNHNSTSEAISKSNYIYNKLPTVYLITNTSENPPFLQQQKRNAPDFECVSFPQALSSFLLTERPFLLVRRGATLFRTVASVTTHSDTLSRDGRSNMTSNMMDSMIARNPRDRCCAGSPHPQSPSTRLLQR